jgi:hypothetical protein
MVASLGMRARHVLCVALGAVALACSGGGGSDSGTGGGGGSGGVSGTGGSSAGSGGLTAGTGGTGTGTGGATSTYPNIGVCGDRGKATADATSFTGYDERYIIGEDGFGTDVCAVRFDLERVGEAPGGCSECTWTHLLEYGNATVVTDADGVCAGSDLALDPAALAKLVGSRVAIGFAKQLGGSHGSARMTYVEATGTWEITGNATWNETTKAFTFDYRSGFCNYGP